MSRDANAVKNATQAGSDQVFRFARRRQGAGGFDELDLGWGQDGCQE
ncbi:hypothetical protein LP421_15430 [Rhizobium sp. RCAM05350]|nr:hypothetical protein LP421_15430 [Rhizobium sp. RCAM05350]